MCDWLVSEPGKQIHSYPDQLWQKRSAVSGSAPSKAELATCSTMQLPVQTRGAVQIQESFTAEISLLGVPVQREVDLGLSVSAAETRIMIMLQLVLQNAR